jgi:phosphoribosylanthranilate isomerase
MTKIKFCGITRAEDAAKAVSLGAAAVGFNFYEGSPRYIRPEAAQVISRLLPAHVIRAGVFVNADPTAVERTARAAALTALQFHGDESADYCRRWRSWQVIKAIRLRDAGDAGMVREFRDAADYLLFDRFDTESFGGTGKTIAEIALEALAKLDVLDRAYLAGGLSPENVGALVRRFRPFAVDVASGVESAPGLKDHGRMEQFTAAVRAASEEGS